MNKFEFAFWIEDPCSQEAVALAQTVLSLLRSRDPVTITALVSEMRALTLKYPRPIAVESSAGAADHPEH